MSTNACDGTLSRTASAIDAGSTGDTGRGASARLRVARAGSEAMIAAAAADGQGRGGARSGGMTEARRIDRVPDIMSVSMLGSSIAGRTNGAGEPDMVAVPSCGDGMPGLRAGRTGRGRGALT